MSNPDFSIENNIVGDLSFGPTNLYTQTGRIIFLKIYPPSQDNYMNPNPNQGASYGSIIGGFYEVLNVKSSFEGGIFTQEIQGAKLAHLNYVEEYLRKV